MSWRCETFIVKTKENLFDIWNQADVFHCLADHTFTLATNNLEQILNNYSAWHKWFGKVIEREDLKNISDPLVKHDTNVYSDVIGGSLGVVLPKTFWCSSFSRLADKFVRLIWLEEFGQLIFLAFTFLVKVEWLRDWEKSSDHQLPTFHWIKDMWIEDFKLLWK